MSEEEVMETEETVAAPVPVEAGKMDVMTALKVCFNSFLLSFSFSTTTKKKDDKCS